MSIAQSFCTVRRMIERHAIGGARAPVVAGDHEALEAELAHDVDLVLRHAPERVVAVVGQAARLAAVAVAAQVGGDHREVPGQARRDEAPVIVASAGCRAAGAPAGPSHPPRRGSSPGDRSSGCRSAGSPRTSRASWVVREFILLGGRATDRAPPRGGRREPRWQASRSRPPTSSPRSTWKADSGSDEPPGSRRCSGASSGSGWSAAARSTWATSPLDSGPIRPWQRARRWSRSTATT